MKVVIHPEYKKLEDFVLRLPNLFNNEGEVIYTGRNILKRYAVGEFNLIVKRFRKPHLINKIAYSYFRLSKACRSYQHACRLQEMEILTPSPVAYIETYKGGLIEYSYYISLESPFEVFRSLYDVPFEEKKDLLKAFAYFAAELHKKDIYHKDFTQGNILFRRDLLGVSFSIIDINRMAFGPVTKEKGYKNFWALWEQVGSLTYIAKCYGYAMGYDEKESVNHILYYNNLFNIRKKSKLAYFSALLFPKL